MERREFLRLSAAAAAAPLIPAGAVAAQVVVPAQTDILWAEAIARAKGRASVASLARDLKVSTPMAEAIQNHLLKKNIVRVGASNGNVVAIRPFQNPLSHHAKGLELLSQKSLEPALEKLEEQVFENDLEGEEPEDLNDDPLPAEDGTDLTDSNPQDPQA